MTGFVLSLAVLTVMLTLSSLAARALRRFAFRSREGLMYPVWLLILLISFLPIKLELPTLPAMIASELGEQALATEAIAPSTVYVVGEGQYVTVTRLEPQLSGENEASEAVKPAGDRLAVRLRRLASAIWARLGLISAIIFALWLAGAVIRFTLSTADYFQAKQLLELSSRDCERRRFLLMLDECRSELGLRREIRLRMLETESLCSPCVCGIFAPTLYLEPGCERLSETELKCVISHELCHIRRHDMLFKLFASFAASVHWFNPSAKRVLRLIYEDCELSCDRSVIEALGVEVSAVYMSTILDFAERFSVSSRELAGDTFGGGLFMSRSGGVSFLKRRYANMKGFRKDRNAVIAATLFVSLCAGMNLLALSSCTSFDPGYFSLSSELSEPVELMVRSYYGLSEDDYITPEMLDGITSLEIIANSTLEGHILADFTVNGEEGYSQAVPKFALQNYWDSIIRPRIEEVADSVDETSYYAANGKLVTAVFDDKIFAFYALKDPYDHRLTERAVEEMELTYPAIREKGSLYVFDPYSSEREVKTIYDCFDDAGLLDGWTIDAEVFDASSLAYFTNLKEVSFVGFTPVNYDFPETVKLTVGGESYDASANRPTPSYTLTEREVYTYAAPTDGSSVVTLGNQSLDYALREYFGMGGGSYGKIPLTSKQLESVTSVVAEVDTELTELLREAAGYEALDKVVYIRYTINGRELPLLPESYSQEDFYALTEQGVVSDASVVAALKAIYTYSEDENRWFLVENASESDIMQVFKFFATSCYLKAELVGQHDCGAYELQYRNKSCRLMGIPARTLDCVDSFDEADRELFPSLTEWELK